MPEHPSKRENLFLGIDVGGTDVKLGLIDDCGALIHSERTSTASLGSPDNVFRHAIDYARERIALLNQSDDPTDYQLRAVGLAVPGVLDTQRHTLTEVVNLPLWLEVPLLKMLCEATGLPACVVNDANAAAFAEHERRRLEHQSLALVTLGTGVGCGVVIAGNPHGGDHGCAGELGHIAVDFAPDAIQCGCGSHGHLESYVGASGIVARLIRRLQHDAAASRNPEPLPPCLQGETLTPREIALAAKLGHRISQQVIDETADYLGRAIGMLGQVINPAVVLLGGAMNFGGEQTLTGRQFLDHIRRRVAATTLAQVGGNMKIEFATLGNHAGMLGAAMVAKQTISQQTAN